MAKITFSRSNLGNGFSNLWRLTVTAVVILLLWQAIVIYFEMPPFILPPPLLVLEKLIGSYQLLLSHSLITMSEIVLGLLLGLLMGLLFALQMLLFKPLRRWLLPVLIASQAIPVFALAPILMLWFGYGMTSKVIMAALIIFFPVTTTCFDGLRYTPIGYLDLAHTMGANKWRQLWHIRLPAALPTLASGIRVAAVVAPIGAVVGEWVGSSGGLGYLMLQANARMQIADMFAALFILALFSIALYYFTDLLLKALIPWHREQTGH
ncbi:ABC transporter permease ['Osedax' symbiont bacterium Rs2_46_30_T18]|nr:ABC transporter permease ['Osedax' symbiont bacterium Rs2_46_30_T18]